MATILLWWNGQPCPVSAALYWPATKSSSYELACSVWPMSFDDGLRVYIRRLPVSTVKVQCQDWDIVTMCI